MIHIPPKQLQQRLLARRLYRELFRWTQSLPSAAKVYLPTTLLQEGDDETEATVPRLQNSLRHAFRRPNDDNVGSAIISQEEQTQQRLQNAMKGLHVALNLDVSVKAPPTSNTADASTSPTFSSEDLDNQDSVPLGGETTTTMTLRAEDLLSAVEWLPPIITTDDSSIPTDDKEKTTTTSTAPTSSFPHVDIIQEFPLFPLEGPIMPHVQDFGLLPLFSHFQTSPMMAGKELQLRIFEPRYRQLYHHLISSSMEGDDGNEEESVVTTPHKKHHRKRQRPKRQLIVPFPHPYLPSQYATHGWLLDVVKVRDVADETNGDVQLLCDHVVTHPVRIHRVINPEAAVTKATYLRVYASPIFPTEDVHETDASCTIDSIYEELEDLLREEHNRRIEEDRQQGATASQRYTRDVVGRLLTACLERPRALWSAVSVYVDHLRSEVMRLQLEIAIESPPPSSSNSTESMATMLRSSTWNWSEEDIKQVQLPYYRHLYFLLIEVATLVPLLMQEETRPEQQVRLFRDHIQSTLCNTKV